MLLLMLEAGMPIDCVLTADTGMEFPEMYRHWDKIDQVLYQERGIHLTILRHPKGFEWLMFDQPKEKLKTLENRAKLGVPLYGNGWPGIRVRWCTGQLKTHSVRYRTRRSDAGGQCPELFEDCEEVHPAHRANPGAFAGVCGENRCPCPR